MLDQKVFPCPRTVDMEIDEHIQEHKTLRSGLSTAACGNQSVKWLSDLVPDIHTLPLK